MEMNRIKLTKKNLMSFQEGKFIESNIRENGKSIYCSYVSPPNQREEQWAAIKKVEADGRICNVFENEEAMLQYYKKFKMK